MSEGNEEKKIIIDEDWKSQAQAEKEALEQMKRRESQAQASDQPASEAPAGTADKLPPASLATLCTTIATQALMAMGQIPNPISGRAEIHLDLARHYIDTLEMLEKKTEGNRTPEEIAMLSQLLHELRLGFIEAQKAVAQAVQDVSRSATTPPASNA